MVGAFDAALDVRDSESHLHCLRVAGYALILARRLGLPEKDLIVIEQGAFLHDVGKLHVPDRILKKAGPLHDLEWKVMAGHAVTGYAMLTAVPTLTEAAEIVLAHHERYDGRGYPHRLEADEIPLGARICAVVDGFDALTSSGSAYRRAVGFVEAYARIDSCSGTQFDPQVVEAFRSISPAQWHAVRECLSSGLVGTVKDRRHETRFRDLVCSGHFDKPNPKVIACTGVMQSLPS